VKFRAAKNLTAVWLFALFLNAFSTALFADSSPRNSAETVYCPLTKKLQPIKAQKKELRKNPLEEVCADEKDKKSLTNELFGKNLLRTNFLDEKQFETIVFDFFQKGKLAFANLPQFPDFPSKTSVKTVFAAVGLGKTNETSFVWKSQPENFNFAANPRPPNAAPVNLFESQNFHALEEISRQISPRAPPFSL
jgi:hypothetical protein